MMRLDEMCLVLLRKDTLASISAGIPKMVTVFLLTLASQMYTDCKVIFNREVLVKVKHRTQVWDISQQSTCWLWTRSVDAV